MNQINPVKYIEDLKNDLFKSIKNFGHLKMPKGKIARVTIYDAERPPLKEVLKKVENKVAALSNAEIHRNSDQEKCIAIETKIDYLHSIHDAVKELKARYFNAAVGKWYELNSWFHFVKMWLKTARCWIDKDFNQKWLKEWNETKQAFDRVEKAVTLFEQPIHRFRAAANCIKQARSNAPILAAIDAYADINKSVHTKIAEKEAEKVGLFKNGLSKLERLKVLKQVLSNPLAPNFYTLSKEEVDLDTLSDLAANELFTPATRSYYLERLAERVIAKTLFTVKLPAVKQAFLPKNLINYLNLLNNLYHGKKPGYLNRPPVTFCMQEAQDDPTEGIELMSVGYRKQQGIFVNQQRLMECDRYLEISSALLGKFSAEILEKSAQEKKGFFVTATNGDCSTYWNGLVTFACRKDVKKIYLTGKQLVPLPSIELLQDQRWTTLLEKLECHTPLNVKWTPNASTESMKMMRAICPKANEPIKEKDENLGGTLDLSGVDIKTAELLLAQHNNKVSKLILPAGTTTELLTSWLERFELIYGVHLDISRCMELDDRIFDAIKNCVSILSFENVLFPSTCKPANKQNTFN